MELGYKTYVLFEAYNNLIPDLPELGWLSKHSEASRQLYAYFSDMQAFLESLYYDQDQMVFRFNSPVVQEAIVDIELAFLRNDIVTAEKAITFIPELLKTHESLKGIYVKVREHKACVYSLNARRLRRPVKAYKVDKAA